MAPWRVEHAELGAPHGRDFRFVVRRHEIHVAGAGHDDRPRLDRLQGAGEIAAVDLIVADVAMLPGPDLGEEIVRVPFQMILLPVAHEVLKRGEAELAIEAVAKEGVRIGPGDVDAAEGAQALFRRS